MWLQENVRKDSCTTSSATQVCQNKLCMAAGSVHLNVYMKNTSKTWKHFALHLTDDPRSHAESLFSAVDRMPPENVLLLKRSAVQNSPK